MRHFNTALFVQPEPACPIRINIRDRDAEEARLRGRLPGALEDVTGELGLRSCERRNGSLSQHDGYDQRECRANPIKSHFRLPSQDSDLLDGTVTGTIWLEAGKPVNRCERRWLPGGSEGSGAGCNRLRVPSE